MAESNGVLYRRGKRTFFPQMLFTYTHGKVGLLHPTLPLSLWALSSSVQECESIYNGRRYWGFLSQQKFRRLGVSESAKIY